MVKNKKLTSPMHIVFDIDGVIVPGYPRASLLAVEKFNLDINRIREFFHIQWKDCREGRTSLKDLLTLELPIWGFQGSVDDYLAFWFDTENNIITETLETVNKLKNKGIHCHIGSNQELLRSSHLWINCNLNAYFHRCFFSCYLGVSKPEFSFYQKVQQRLDVHSSQILLIDDQKENIKAAQKHGWHGYLWPDEKHLLEALLSI